MIDSYYLVAIEHVGGNEINPVRPVGLESVRFYALLKTEI